MSDHPRIECSACGAYHGSIAIAFGDTIAAEAVYDVPEGIRRPHSGDSLNCQLCGNGLLIGGVPA